MNLIYTTARLVHGQVNELLDKHMMDKKKIVPILDPGSLVEMCQETISIL